MRQPINIGGEEIANLRAKLTVAEETCLKMYVDMIARAEAAERERDGAKAHLQEVSDKLCQTSAGFIALMTNYATLAKAGDALEKSVTKHFYHRSVRNRDVDAALAAYAAARKELTLSEPNTNQASDKPTA